MCTARKVLLPREISKKLTDLTRLVEEVNGILLYRRRGIYCFIDALFITGTGIAGHVDALLERVKIINEFFRVNSDYQFIKFHTHSKGTIEKFGQYFAKNFSREDINYIKKQLKHNRDYIEMLVTPEIKILSGIDNPELVVVNNHSGYKNKSQAVSQSLEIIAKDLGYNIDKLPATMKKK